MLIDDVQPTHGPGDDRLAELCRNIVRDAQVTSCGVSINIDAAQAVTAHATDELATRLEELQHTLGEGPGIDSARSRQLVAVPDLTDPHGLAPRLWPLFVSEAVKDGLRATFAFPMRIGAVTMGALSLYRDRPGALAKDQVNDGWRCADAVARALVDLGPDAEPEMTDSLVVHQAAGMAMVQLGTSISEALDRLRSRAFAEGISVDELARAVVARHRRMTEESP